MLVGLDVGYGQTKAVAENGKQVVFPSYTAKVDTTLATNDSKVIRDKSGDWLVGHDAVAMANARTPTVDSGWYRSIEYRMLVMKAMRELKADKIEIVTGLPIAHMKDHHKQLTSEMKSWKTFGVKVEVRKVIPQPFGSLMSVAYDENQKPLDGFKGRVGIVDIGRGTIDAVEIRDHQVNWSSYACEPEGVSRVFVALQNELSDKHGLTIPLAEIPALVEAGEVQKFGKRIDIKPAIKRAKKATMAPLGRIVTELWQNQASLSRLVVTGGGAALLRDEIKAAFHKDLVVIPDDPGMANAIGYLRTAMAR